MDEYDRWHTASVFPQTREVEVPGWFAGHVNELVPTGTVKHEGGNLVLTAPTPDGPIVVSRLPWREAKNMTALQAAWKLMGG